MVNIEILRKRINKLEEYLRILSRLSQYSYEEFIAEPERYGAAERFLQVAIETINDLGNHVVADLELGEVSWQSDIPRLLAEHGYLSKDLEQRWMRMTGFRNILGHEYLDIDHELVYDIMKKSDKDFRDIMQIFA
ncbi:MAG: type VII toxin-antitoxin system HepT family RNase toxin, partial [Desulfomonilaceae bacterium]